MIDDNKITGLEFSRCYPGVIQGKVFIFPGSKSQFFSQQKQKWYQLISATVAATEVESSKSTKSITTKFQEFPGVQGNNLFYQESSRPLKENFKIPGNFNRFHRSICRNFIREEGGGL